MKGARLLVVVGILLAAAGLVAWALRDKVEWSEQDVWVGYSGEARVNDFLAAQRLLEKLGQRTSSIRGLPGARQLPGRNDVIILPRRQVRISPGQASALVGWVARGGLLIAEGLTAESKEAQETQDPIFQAVGARLVTRPEAPTPGGPALDVRAFDEANRDVQVALGGRTYRVRLGAWRELLDLGHRATYTARNASGAKLLQYDLGRGRMVLCTDLACLDNGNLADGNHAGFLAALATDWAPGNHVWIVYREEPPSLRAWLASRAWRVLVALSVLTVAALWSAAPRFGPRIPDPPEGRRSLLEHLAACGRFQWARKNGAGLLHAARQAALARIHQAHPGWAHLEPAELCLRLARSANLGEARIARALYREAIHDPREFTEAIQTLELLRKLP
jgi:hypothetical protein